jgi:hypothetical protein
MTPPISFTDEHLRCSCTEIESISTQTLRAILQAQSAGGA